MNKELQQASSESTKLQKELDRLNQDKLKLETEKLQFQKEIEWFKAKKEEEFNKEKLE